MGEPMETIEGQITHVIYQNPENGYTVLRVKGGQGSQTVVGNMAQVSAGEHISVTGCWVDHPSFGPQFKAAEMTVAMPTQSDDIYEYLASGIIKGIRARTAKRIVDKFGVQALVVIESEPEALADARIMTLKKALAVQADFLQKAGMRRVVEFLGQFQLPVTLAMSLWRRYSDRCIDILRADPYLLLEEELGVRFSEADRIASACGIAADDLLRVQAGVLYTLRHNLDNGHCFLPRAKLITAANQLLMLEDEAWVEEGLDALRLRGRVVIAPVAGLEAVYLADLYENETYIAQRVAALCQAELRVPENLEQLIDAVQREQRITYASEQREAVRMAAQRQIMLLTGGPGTGKTTSLRGILGLFEMLGLKTFLCAPTGRAAKRLGELCDAEASTIHRLLGAGYDPESDQLVFQHNEDDPLDCRAVIVDETSMVDVPLMEALLAAQPNS